MPSTGKRQRDPEAEAIGRRVREVRQSRHMTLERLAEEADTTIQFLSQVEKGEQSMTMVKFGRLAKALGVSSDYLLYGHSLAAERSALAAEYLGGLNIVERDLVSQTVIALRGILDALAPEHD